VSIVYRTTLTPSKLELLSGWLPTRPWYQGTGKTADLTKAGGFRLDDPAGEVGIEFMVVTEGAVTYHVPLTYRGSPLDGADGALIDTMEHGVLGKRWAYDGTRDPVLVAALLALIQGTAVPQLQSVNDTPDPTVAARPLPTGPIIPESFTVIDSENDSSLRLAHSAADLTLTIARVLVPAGNAPQADGTVTAPLHSLAAPTPRAVFAGLSGLS
jgi:hypothetical protein